MAPNRVLVVDDDTRHLKVIEKVFKREGYEVQSASDGSIALTLLRDHAFDLMVTDLMMPKMNGVELLKAARLVQPTVEVIVMTAFGTIERAVEAIKEGAYDFIEKPIKRATLVKSAKRALERKALVAENVQLKGKLASLQAERELVGQAEPFRRVMEMVQQVAPTQATVLVEGASGTGKELVARALHRLSPRADRAFVAVNCAALPESVLESEIFGHERGAFTGAHQRKPGRFELADGGTLFLDEIGELQQDIQAKLLRVLQEGEFERVGGTKPVKVDVRIITATNKDLQAEVQRGQFREDLFYRLNVIAIRLPSLAERHDDIPLLAEHFLQHFALRHQRQLKGFSPEALSALNRYRWPGNVRELRNVIERCVVLTNEPIIPLHQLPPEVQHAVGSQSQSANSLTVPLGTPLDQIKREVILETLSRVKGDKKVAAQLLGIATRTIYRVLEDQRDED